MPDDFEDLVNQSIRIDNSLQKREAERRCSVRRSSEPQGALWGYREFRRSSSATKLAPEEHQWRLEERACFYCGQPSSELLPVKRPRLTRLEEGLGESFSDGEHSSKDSDLDLRQPWLHATDAPPGAGPHEVSSRPTSPSSTHVFIRPESLTSNERPPTSCPHPEIHSQLAQ
ncbi:hypothetical protein L3Q82_021355, partial [Scortum barcoo]